MGRLVVGLAVQFPVFFVTVILFRCHTDFKLLICITLSGSTKVLENKKGYGINCECQGYPWFKGVLFVLAADPDNFFPALPRASSARDRARSPTPSRNELREANSRRFESRLTAWLRKVQPSAPFSLRRSRQTNVFPPRQCVTCIFKHT
jgi:hypothetical protein